MKISQLIRELQSIQLARSHHPDHLDNDLEVYVSSEYIPSPPIARFIAVAGADVVVATDPGHETGTPIVILKQNRFNYREPGDDHVEDFE